MRVVDIIKRPQLLFLTFGHREWFNWMSDEEYLKIAFWARMGKWPNIEQPQTFNEKLQWLKLYDRNPFYTKLVDKFEVKNIVSKKIGSNYIIPTIGVWDSVDEIDFDSLPNQFVLKCTHDSGGLVICKDKSKLNINSVKKKLATCLKHSYYWGMREWPYKDVKPRVIAEQYMEDEMGELRDYKFFCFGGKVKMFKIDFDRFIEHHANYYDVNLQLLPFGEVAFPPKPEVTLSFPSQINEMFQLAEKLSKDIPFLRVDFYQVNSQVYFGELTFFPATGMGKWTDDKWDLELGSWLKLPKNS